MAPATRRAVCDVGSDSLSCVKLSDLTAHQSCTLIEALRVIDRGAEAICCLVDDDNRLSATLTDGDVRRALIAGASLEAAAIDHAQTRPMTVDRGTPRALVLDLMQSVRLRAVPEIDADRRLTALHTLSDLVSARELPNVAVIMAGGRGTRLGALTRDVPKPLMKVAGRSILEWIILGLVGDGIRTIHVSINHKADQVVEAIGDGSALGCEVTYLRESPDKPLGTSGSLTLIEQLPTQPMIVMNGDLMVEFDAARLLERHTTSGAVVTIGVRNYVHTVPFGVVDIDTDGQVTSIVEKPDLQTNINTAVYCINPETIALLPAGEPSTMPELVQLCLDAGKVVSAWPMASDWIDVGTPSDLARAKGQE